MSRCPALNPLSWQGFPGGAQEQWHTLDSTQAPQPWGRLSGAWPHGCCIYWKKVKSESHSVVSAAKSLQSCPTLCDPVDDNFNIKLNKKLNQHLAKALSSCRRSFNSMTVVAKSTRSTKSDVMMLTPMAPGFWVFTQSRMAGRFLCRRILGQERTENCV